MDAVFTVDAVLRAKVTKINGRNYSALGKEKKKGFSFDFCRILSRLSKKCKHILHSLLQNFAFRSFFRNFALYY